MNSEESSTSKAWDKWKFEESDCPECGKMILPYDHEETFQPLLYGDMRPVIVLSFTCEDCCTDWSEHRTIEADESEATDE